MNKAVLISADPRNIELMQRGVQTLILQKSKPKIPLPFKCYIYCSKPNTTNPHEILEMHGCDGRSRKMNGMVCGEFVCNIILPVRVWAPISAYSHYPGTGLTDREICEYLNRKAGWVWDVSDLGLYEVPKPLSDFTQIKHTTERVPAKAPKGWCYVEEVE